MELDRLTLHAALQVLFPTLPLYFRPNDTLSIQYPCVIYDVYRYKGETANNERYSLKTQFTVNVLSPVPGIEDANLVLRIPTAAHINSYTTSDIVHEVFRLTIKGND